VFGIPDEEYGESLAAHIEIGEGFQLHEDEVRKFVRDKLAGFKVPKVVVFDNDLWASPTNWHPWLSSCSPTRT
jgi:long-chain acyl-CoA synthetase